MAPWSLSLVLAASLLPGAPAESPFSDRGYYITFMRMPTFGLDAWKDILDDVRDDGGNLVVLWAAGAFRSRKFPDTWAHNADHANVRHDFLRDLIDHAHQRGLRVLLGLTPYGYDGVNRMPLSHPDWKATGPDGRPTARMGIFCHGFNLCPARDDTCRFMLDYTREMLDFYPNADGLFLESSDYAVCHGPECRGRFFDHEFAFVRQISDEAWKRNKDALVVVYPHYFNGANVPGLNVAAARQTFDPRWATFYTPHSAPLDPALVKQSRHSLWWDEAPALHTPTHVRDGARRAKAAGCSGYLPSLEAYSFVAVEPEEGQRYTVGRRQIPFGFGWLKEGQNPYRELPIRINRLAFRAYTRNPDLSDDAFRAQLGRALFGAASTPTAVDDALALQRVFATERSWCQASPLADPTRVRAMKAAGALTDGRRDDYRHALDRVRAIEAAHRDPAPPFAELHRIAKWLVDQWSGDNATLLAQATPDEKSPPPTPPAASGRMPWGDPERSGRPFAKDPCVIKHAGRYLMYYSMGPYLKDRLPPGRKNGWAIGIAESRDLCTWKKVGEILPEQPCERNGLVNGRVIFLDGTLHLFYNTYGNGKDDALCHATSRDGLTWKRDPTNPILRARGDWNSGRAIDCDVLEHRGQLLLYFATRDPSMKDQLLVVAAADRKSDFSRDAWKQLGDGPVLKPELP